MWTLVHPDRVSLLQFRSELAAELYRQEWMLDEFVVRAYLAVASTATPSPTEDR